MAKYKLRVNVEDERSTADHYRGLVERQTANLRSSVKGYLQSQSGLQAGDHFTVDVQLSELIIKPGLGEMPRFREQVTLDVSGVFAGEAFEFENSHLGPVTIGHPQADLTADDRPDADDQTRHELLFEELMNLTLEGFEESAGRQSTPIARLWFAIKLAIVGTALAVMAAICYFCWTSNFITNPKWLVAIAGMFGIGAYFIGLTIGAACMPLKFFEEHVEGHRVMGFVNTDDPAHAQRQLRIGLVVLILLAVFMVFVYRTTFG